MTTCDDFKHLHPERKKPAPSIVRRLKIEFLEIGSVHRRLCSVTRRPVITEVIEPTLQKQILSSLLESWRNSFARRPLQDAFCIIYAFVLLNFIIVLHWKTKMETNGCLFTDSLLSHSKRGPLCTFSNELAVFHMHGEINPKNQLRWTQVTPRVVPHAYHCLNP